MNNIHKRGFASLSPERLREIASKGGKASPGNFKNDPERARELGRKGGKVTKHEKTNEEPARED